MTTATKQPSPHAMGKKDPLKSQLREIKKGISGEQFAALTDAVKAAWQNDKTSAKEFGLTLLKLKDAFYQHGKFTKWLRANNIDQNRASYCLRVAQNKVQEAAKKQAAEPQTLSKKQVDKLFRIIKTPFEPAQMARGIYDINSAVLGGMVTDFTTRLGWKEGVDYCNSADPKFVEATRKFHLAVLNLCNVLLLIEPAPAKRLAKAAAASASNG
jgi:predicted XRE-type DNA-binding protein